MSIPRFFARQPVLVNMLMLAIIVAGFISLNRMPMEETPAIDMDSVLIIVPYFGAAPEDVEKLITLPIEEKIKNLPDIDFVWASSAEGRSVFFIQYEVGLDNFDQAVIDLKTEVDKVKRDLPDEAADDLFYLKISTNEMWPIMSIAMGGDYPIASMNQVAEALQDELSDLEDVVKVDIWGLLDREIWIEADPSRLNAFGVSLAELSKTIQMANINLPAGRLEMGREEFLVRAMGEVTDPGEIGDLVVRAAPDGSAIRVKDVANINDTFARDEVISRLNGRASVTLRIFMASEGSIVEVAEKARQTIAEFKKRMPGLDIVVRNDRSKDVTDSISALTTNAMSGLILVALLMTLFIGVRSAVLAVIGIPFSFLCAFIFLDFTGGTINTLSLFAFILVLGMIVDDAIIIIENVYRHMEEGKSPVQAAIEGSEQVMWPVVAAILTTIAAFLPLLMMEGVIGKFMAVMPIVVALALAGSLVESLVILPSHLADFGGLPKSKGDRLGDRLFIWLSGIYEKQVTFILNHKYLVVLAVVIATIVSISVAASVLRIEMFADEKINTERLLVKLDLGTKIEETDRIFQEIEKRVKKLSKKEINYVASIVGLVIENQQWVFRSDGGMINFELGEKEDRRSNTEIKNDIRKLIADIPEIKSAYFTKAGHGPPTGNPVELRVLGDDKDQNLIIARMIEEDLKNKKGVEDVEVNYSEGKKELRFMPDRVKMAAYGIDMTQLSTLLRMAIDGYEATKFRNDDGEEIKVLVMYRESDRDDMDDLKQLIVSTPLGVHVPLSELGEFSIARGASQIQRYNAKRSITITANVNKVDINSDEANRYLKEKYKDISRRYPGHRLDFGGEAQEQEKSFKSLLEAFVVALIIIYLILATQFQSFSQPMVVLFTVPFSMLGVAVGLIAMNLTFSLVAGISVVALSGVVVNDSLVLVDFVNKARAGGMSRRQALVVSGTRRMRPILLTTITTIAGLMPMATGIGGESLTWQPMAICIIWGLAFATFLTLFIIPSAYAILDDWMNYLRKWFGMQTTTQVLRGRAKQLQDDLLAKEIAESVEG